MLLLYLPLCVTFEQQPSQNHHLSHEKAKPHAEIRWPALNCGIYSYSHLLVTVIEAILCIVAVAVACVFTVIFHLWLHWITAKRAHPFSPAKQETKQTPGEFFPQPCQTANLRNHYLGSLIPNQHYNSRQSEAHRTRYSSLDLNPVRSIIISGSIHSSFSITKEKKMTKLYLKSSTSSVCGCTDSSAALKKNITEKQAAIGS